MLVGDEGARPLAAALRLDPPYRAEAVRQDGERWSVGASRIDLVELPPEVVGEEIELTVAGGERTVTVDGMRSYAAIPALERLGEARSREYVVRAERVAGTRWEVQATPL